MPNRLQGVHLGLECDKVYHPFDEVLQTSRIEPEEVLVVKFWGVGRVETIEAVQGNLVAVGQDKSVHKEDRVGRREIRGIYRALRGREDKNHQLDVIN